MKFSLLHYLQILLVEDSMMQLFLCQAVHMYIFNLYCHKFSAAIVHRVHIRSYHIGRCRSKLTSKAQIQLLFFGILAQTQTGLEAEFCRFFKAMKADFVVLIDLTCLFQSRVRGHFNK